MSEQLNLTICAYSSLILTNSGKRVGADHVIVPEAGTSAAPALSGAPVTAPSVNSPVDYVELGAHEHEQQEVAGGV